MQAFEWTKLIREGVRPWANPFGAEQFGSSFFMITGFHGFHVSVGVIFLIAIGINVGEATTTPDGLASTVAEAAMKSSRSWASTGTSSISFGSSFSRSSIFGENADNA